MTKASINKHQYVYDIIKKISQTRNCTIIFEGGEIGLITSNELLEELFKKFDQKIIVNTNGEFFKQDRTMLYPYIDKIFYHIAPDTKTKIKIEQIDWPIDIVYGVVDDNQQSIDEFIEFNNHINIAYSAIEKSNFDEELFNNTSKDRTACITTNPFASIDLAREVLCMCSARGCHITIPLTEENFIKVLTEFNIFSENEMCQTCYRTCKANDEKYIINRKKEFSQILC